MTYENLFRLAADLRGMAEAMLHERLRPNRPAVFLHAAQLYTDAIRPKTNVSCDLSNCLFAWLGTARASLRRCAPVPHSAGGRTWRGTARR